MESGLTPVCAEQQPCIDLTHCHFRRVVGEFAVFGTWLKIGKDSEPCLVITPQRMFEGKPAVIPLSSAWKCSQMAFADPKVVANQVRQFAIGMNKDSLAQYRDWETDRKSTRLNSSHSAKSRMPSSA